MPYSWLTMLVSWRVRHCMSGQVTFRKNRLSWLEFSASFPPRPNKLIDLRFLLHWPLRHNPALFIAETWLGIGYSENGPPPVQCLQRTLLSLIVFCAVQTVLRSLDYMFYVSFSMCHYQCDISSGFTIKTGKFYFC